MFRFIAIMAAISAALYSPPVVWAYIEHGRSVPLVVLTVLALTVTAGSVLGLAIVPHYWLSKIVKRETNEMVEMLEDQIAPLDKPQPGKQWHVGDPQFKALTVALILEQQDTRTYDYRAIWQVGVALTAAVLPYAVSLLIG